MLPADWENVSGGGANIQNNDDTLHVRTAVIGVKGFTLGNKEHSSTIEGQKISMVFMKPEHSDM